MKYFNQYRYQNFSFALEDFTVIRFNGKETGEYLSRQLATEVLSLSNGTGCLSVRLNRTAQVQYFFYLIKDSEDLYYGVIHKDFLNDAIDDLNKFIIMEDIEINQEDRKISIHVDNLNKYSDGYEIKWCDLNARLCFDQEKVEKINNEIENIFFVTTGWPIKNYEFFAGRLVNETVLNDICVSYDKGCYLGQETASKIHHRRGAAKKMGVLESKKEIDGALSFQGKDVVNPISFFKNGETYYTLCELKRELHVDDRNLLLNNKVGEELTVVVNILPYYKDGEASKRSESLMNWAIEKFHKGKVDEALSLLDDSICIYPENVDAIESKGAILGQLERYDEAISVMDELLKVDKNSVMAHTNKSLFFMKQGKIEEAEEEKSLATVASFQKLGEEAKQKKEAKALADKEMAEELRKEGMFKQVLELDANDELANFGLSSIEFRRGNYDKSMDHALVVVKENPKYSAAYPLVVKSMVKLEKVSEAIEYSKKGIEIATKQGDLMPANELQSILTELLAKSNA